MKTTSRKTIGVSQLAVRLACVCLQSSFAAAAACLVCLLRCKTARSKNEIKKGGIPPIKLVRALTWLWCHNGWYPTVLQWASLRIINSQEIQDSREQRFLFRGRRLVPSTVRLGRPTVWLARAAGAICLSLIAAVSPFTTSSEASIVWSRKADAPTSFASDGSPAAISGKIYVFGGWYSSSAHEYDPVTDVWTQKAAMPSARGSTVTLEANGNIYMAGGNPVPNGSPDLDVYNTQTDSWQRKAAMPNALWGGWGVAGGVVANKAYVVGGYNWPNHDENFTREYDFLTDGWSLKAPMPIATSWMNAAVYGNNIYVVGGQYGTGYYTYLNIIQVYDSLRDTWSVISGLPIYVVHAGVVAYNGRLYIFGGNTTAPPFPKDPAASVSNPRVYSYDLNTSTFAEEGYLPSVDEGQVCIIDNKVYLIGAGSTGVETWEGAVVGVSTNVAVSNVRAYQPPGTTLVDLSYDFSGAGSAYSVSVDVSSDGGASFTVPATHFTGDGVTSPTAPGGGRHIVWDAGADFPSQFSTKMRLKVAVGSAFAVSPIFTVDTRMAQTGTLTGLVQASGAPVANAQVRIDGTSFAASSGADGRFTLANVPAGSGYLLKVSAAGFASKPVPGITVTSGTTDLGTIQLAPLAGPYRLVPLQPDVNPPTTRIEDGGVAYRYYRVLTANASAPAGQVTVSLLAAGGGTIPQGGDTSIYWAGYQAGISDDDGIVRLSIPSSAVGAPGLSATLQVAQAGTVATTFSAQVVPRTYYQVWKHKVGGGASGTIAAWKVGGTAALETELRHRWQGNAVFDETIEAKWEAQGRAGLEISTPGMKLGSLKAGAGAGAGGYLGVDIASRHRFLADTSDEVLNLYKVLVALGGPMVESDGPAHSLADLLSAYYGVDLLQSTLVGTSGEIHLGGYADGEALFEAGSFGNLNAKVGGEFDANLGGFVGYEDTKLPAEHATVLGLEAELSGGAGGMLGYMKYNQSKLRGLGLQFAGTVGQTLTGRAVAPAGSLSPSRVEVEFRGSSESGIDLSLIGWKGLGGTLAPNLWVETSETLTYDLPASDSMDKLAVLGSAWQLLKTGFTGQSQLKPQHADDIVGGILDAPDADNNMLGYARTLYTATVWEMPLDAEVQAIAGGLGLSLDAKVERGAEGVLEQGQIWHSLRMPLQWYTNNTADLIPSDTLLAKEAVWIGYAMPHLSSALHKATVFVSGVTGAAVSAGNAALKFGGGVMDEGAQLTSKWWKGLWSGGSSIQVAARQALRDPMYGQSSLVPSNYVYGIGGIYRFESTNAFHGVGTLAIGYSDTDAVGLNEADLRIYRQNDDGNGWVLIGGTVDTVSNIVTAIVTNLGTYAVAPPLPTGDLPLILSTNALPADGVSQLNVIVTNLTLNTGMVATQEWLFTAVATGVQILNPDLDTNAPGVQVYSTNGAVALLLRAPLGGYAASISIGSAAGNAFGTTEIQLVDNMPPSTPSNVGAAAGQSRIWVSWSPNNESDFAGYRVYYRRGLDGPPYDGVAAVEGVPSPAQVGGTNCLLRGLLAGTNYFVAVSAVDTTGNESLLSPAIQVTTTPGPPAPPTAVSARFGQDGTNVLMWALSEDDGYNDRDVVRYDVLRAVLPDESYVKVGEAAAGIGLYSETNLTVALTQYLRYAVVAVASNGVTSSQALASRLMANGTGMDNDGDGIPDSWMIQYFGHPIGQPGDQSFAWNDPAGDGLSNLQKYLLGLNPLVPARPYLQPLLSPTNGNFALNIQGLFGRSVTLEVSTDLTNWQTLTNLTSNDAVIYFEDSGLTNSGSLFYRAVVP